MLLLPLRVYVTGFFENRAFRLAHVRPAGCGTRTKFKHQRAQASGSAHVISHLGWTARPTNTNLSTHDTI